MKPHKHAEIIKAWADGAEIQVWRDTIVGPFWKDVENPQWDDRQTYRIKPAEKVVRYLWAYKHNRLNENWNVSTVYLSVDEAIAAFDCLTESKKLEWSREEFDE